VDPVVALIGLTVVCLTTFILLAIAVKRDLDDLTAGRE
jgi:hypothetical protein